MIVSKCIFTRSLPKIIYFTLFIFLGFDSAHAQFDCGSNNIFAKTTEWMIDFSKRFGFAPSLGGETVQCGFPGENVKFCRQCGEGGDFKSFGIISPMLRRSQKGEWLNQLLSTTRSTAFRISPAEYELESYMGHTRPGESHFEYSQRVGSNGGEAYLFTHRKILKMIQFELTVSGAPCLTRWSGPPGSWDDPRYPISKGPGVREKLTEANHLLNSISEESFLKTTSLNSLGNKIRLIHSLYGEVYGFSETDQQTKCSREKALSCDELSNIKMTHENPLYWQLHLQYDDLIGNWLRANGKTQIEVDCSGKSNCYEWRGSFTKGYPF